MQVGGGELQVGLTLGLGGGDVRVTAVQERAGNAVGFSVEATAPGFFYIVTSDNDQCASGSSFTSAAPITRVDFCSGGTGCP